MDPYTPPPSFPLPAPNPFPRSLIPSGRPSSFHPTTLDSEDLQHVLDSRSSPSRDSPPPKPRTHPPFLVKHCLPPKWDLTRSHSPLPPASHVHYSGIVLMRWHRLDLNPPARDRKRLFWQEFRAFLVAPPILSAAYSPGASSLLFCRVHNWTHTCPIHTLPLNLAVLSIHSPSEGSLAVLPCRASRITWIIHPPTLIQSVDWYRALVPLLHQQNRFPIPSTLRISVPDAFNFSFDTPNTHPSHANISIRTPVLWTTKVWDACHAALLDLISQTPSVPPAFRNWVITINSNPSITWVLGWRRGDSIVWVDDHTQFAITPWFMESTHVLELRAVVSYPSSYNFVPPHTNAILYSFYTTAMATSIAEGYLLFKTRNLKWRSWALKFGAQVGHLGRFLCLAPARNNSQANRCSRTSNKSEIYDFKTDKILDTTLTCSQSNVLRSATRIMDLLEVVQIHVSQPCSLCSSVFKGYLEIATFNNTDSPLVTLDSHNGTKAENKFIVFTSPSENIGWELVAGSHTAVHEWVTRLAATVVRVHLDQYAWNLMYRAVYTHNMRVFKTPGEKNQSTVDFVADPRMVRWHMFTNPLKIASHVYLKSKYRAHFKPTLVLITEEELVFYDYTSAPKRPRKLSNSVSPGGYRLKQRIGWSSRVHVLTGIVNHINGTPEFDEYIDTPAKVWSAAAAFAEDDLVSSEEEEPGPHSDVDCESPTASVGNAREGPRNERGVSDACHIKTWLPPVQPRVITVNEGPHQTFMTLWIPPHDKDVLKRHQRRGKVYVLECRRKADRDQLLVAVQHVLRHAP